MAPAWALSVPERPQFYVNDYAGLLSPDVRASLEEALGRFERETSNQLVIAIFDSLEGGSLEDFSIRLAEKWKVGQKNKDNGILLIVFKNDRQVRIEVGYGLEGALPDILADKIIRREIVPRFREGRYDEGVTAAVGAILAATKGEYKLAPSLDDRMQDNAPIVFFAMLLYFSVLGQFITYALTIYGCVIFLGLFPGLFTGVFFVALLMMLRRLLFANYLGQTLSRRGSGWYGGSIGGWGGGGFGGGFGGGGGGGFGGGGASGRW